MPGSWAIAFSVWNRATGRAVVADKRLASGRQDGRHALEALGDRRQAICERREVAGDQREDAVPEEVDPVERVPAILPEVDLAEP